MTTDKISKKSLGLLGAGAVFLFNPCVNIIDILPDFIGYIMIIAAIDPAADINKYLADSRKSFTALAALSAGKLLCCGLLPVTDNVFKVLLTFVFAVAEAVLFVPAVLSLFRGLNYIGIRYGITSVYRVYTKKALKKQTYDRFGTSDSLRTFTLAAFFVRAALAVLPTLPYLSMYEYIGDVSQPADWADFVVFFYIVAGAVVLAVNIPWLVKFRRFVRGIASDEKLIETLNSCFNQKRAEDKGFFAAKQAKIAGVLLLLGAVFCLDLYFDYINYLPGGIAALFFGAAMLYLRYHSRAAVPGTVLCAVWAPLSALSLYLQQNYAANNYKPMSYAVGIGRAEEMYPRIMLCSLAEALVMAAVFLCLSLTVTGMLKSHCRLYEEGTVSQRLGKGTKVYRSVCRRLIPCAVFAAAIAVMKGVYPWACIYYPEAWMLNVLFTVLLAVFAVRAYDGAQSELYDKIVA